MKGRLTVKVNNDDPRVRGVMSLRWAEVIAVEKAIRETETIRDNMMRSVDKAMRQQLAQTFGDKLQTLRRERIRMEDAIEADRGRLARMLITSLAACDLAAAMTDRFACECRKVSGWSEAGKDYSREVAEAANMSKKAVKAVDDAERLWETVVSTLDSPGDEVVSRTYARLAQELTDKIMPEVEAFEENLSDNYTKIF
jgi:hypothetical protein